MNNSAPSVRDKPFLPYPVLSRFDTMRRGHERSTRTISFSDFTGPGRGYETAIRGERLRAGGA